MHQLRSKKTVLRFRFAALLLCATVLLAAATVAVTALAVANLDRDRTWLGFACGTLALVTGLSAYVAGTGASCPLCMAPVMVNRGCSRNRRARKLMGSHRLRVALSILFLNSFRCPYCNEPTAIKARQRNPNSRKPGR